MKYHRALPLIKTGDLLAFSGTWFMSKAIQWFTKSEISHVGIACWVTFNGANHKTLCMFESMEGANVRIIPLYKTLDTLYWNKGGTAYWKALNPGYDGKDLMDFCVEHWIDAYASTYQFLVAASPRLRWLRRLRGKSADTGISRFHCSELIATGLKEQDYEFPMEPPVVTPGILYNFDCWNHVGVKLEYSSRKQVFGQRLQS